MAKRIAEVEVVANLDSKKYHAELKALTASTIAELDAIGREKVRVNIDIEKNELDREILAVKKKLNELSKIKKGEDGYKQAAANTKQFQRYLKDLQLQMLENRQAAKELGLAFKILGISEKEHQDQLKSLRALSDDHKKAVLSDAEAVREHNDAVSDSVGLMQRLKGAVTEDREAIRKLNAVWRVFTNSQNPLETFRKTLREPVKIGPFTATVRGLLTFAAALGPVLMSLGGSVVAMAGTIGTALVSSLQLGTAALGGFGQMAAGLVFALKPVAEEMKISQQATDAYQRAVLKYGEGSKQAKKAQEQMNNVLKNVSPLARQAATSFSEAKTSFMQLTNPTRESAGRLLTDLGRTARQMSGQFAVNTNTAASGIQQGMAGFLGQVRKSQSEKGGGPFNQMFAAAASAARPLTAALGNITMYLTRIGASASRHIGPMIETFRNWSQSLLNGASNTGALNAKVDRMVLSLKSVDNLTMAAARWLGALAGASDEAGRSLTDSLTGKFRQWTQSLNNDDGRKKWTEWFKEAAALSKDFLNAIIPIVSTIGAWSAALTPFTAGMMAATAELSKLIGWVLQLPLVSEAVRIFGAAFASIFIGSRIYGAALAFDALVRSIMGLRLVLPVITALSIRIPILSAAFVALGTSATLAMGVFALVVAGIGALAYGLSKIGENSGFKKATEETKQLEDAMRRTREEAQNLRSELSSEVDRKYMAKGAYESAKARVDSLTPGTKEHTAAVRDMNAAYRELEDATTTVAEKTKQLTDKAGVTNALEQVASTAKQLRTGFRMDSMPFLKGTEIEGLGKQLEQITGTESIDKLKQLKDAAQAVANDPGKYGDIAASEFGQQAALIDTLITKYDQLKNARADAAAVPIMVQRADKGLGIDDASMQRSLGQLAQKNYSLALKIGLKVQDQGDAAKLADQALQALQAGMSGRAVTAALDLDPTAAAAALQNFIDTHIPPKTVTTEPNDLGVGSLLAGIRNFPDNVVKTVTTVAQTKKFAGGITSAAGGYSIDSAIGRASNRPTRNVRSGARITEPTLALGEENRTEYVIATNPAYRAANVGYLKAAASDLGLMVVESAAGGGTPWGRRKVLLNAIFNPSMNDDKRKAFSRSVRGQAANIKGIEDEAGALSKMMDNDEKRNQPNAWKRHKRMRDKMLRQLLGIYRRAYPAAGRNNRRALRGMIAGVEGDLLDLKKDTFDGVVSKSAEELKQAELDRQTKEISTLRTSLAAAEAFNTVSGGMLAESFGPLASSSRRSLKGAAGGQTIIINTLHPADPNTLSAIGSAATAGIGYQGATASPRVTVGA